MKRALTLLILGWMSGAAMAAVDPGAATLPRLEYVPLAPGTYALQRIQPVRDARLLDVEGHLVPLQPYVRGKITLLTFFYTYCADPLGCPYARETLRQVREGLRLDPHLAAAARFVSISFDPANDTPPALARYGATLGNQDAVEWRLLTARSVPELLPLLEDLGQDVSVQKDENGRPTRTLHHMLKMFLIDADGQLREIYTLAFLQPQVILNDIKTLHLEASGHTGLSARSR
jgi:protein SCO1